MQHILVTGGAGVLGRLLVKQLSAAGYPVRGMSRRKSPADDWPGAQWAQADLETGEGIEAAVEGVEIIVHCAGSSKGDEDKARNLVRAASRGRSATPGVHLGRRRQPDPSEQLHRPHNVRLLRIQTGRRAHSSRVRPAVDHAARHPVPLLDPEGGTIHGEAARRAASGRFPVPADRRRRSGGPARRAGAWHTGRAGTRHGRTEGVQHG